MNGGSIVFARFELVYCFRGKVILLFLSTLRRVLGEIAITMTTMRECTSIIVFPSIAYTYILSIMLE